MRASGRAERLDTGWPYPGICLAGVIRPGVDIAFDYADGAAVESDGTGEPNLGADCEAANSDGDFVEPILAHCPPERLAWRENGDGDAGSQWD